MEYGFSKSSIEKEERNCLSLAYWDKVMKADALQEYEVLQNFHRHFAEQLKVYMTKTRSANKK